ncbi:mandelate racemase/muconate lactonizing enzyme family protein [Craurococcus roseus]|uniref:Mandelate racemase/muconate lactonizing enzyme family protein n=1 Tax=Craurococcus roseus TaxID=77585 RepID=A0ABP3QTA5_9PROT
MSGFTIARIGAFVLRAPIAEPVVTSFFTIRDRVSVLVRVEDADGAHGWGEVWCNFPSYGAEHRGLVLHRTIAPMALGRTVDDPVALWRELAMRTHAWALQSGDAGAFAAPLAGLDAALWDLKARRAGLPLARLLGGEVRDVPVYASGLNPGNGPETAERARAEGHRRFKQKIGFGEEVDFSNLRRIASGLRGDEALLVDANQGWTAEEARRMALRLNELPLGWVEEPIAADRPEAEWRALAEAYAAPLAAGENLRGQDLLRAASDPWLGVVQPDIGKWGGVSGCFAVGQAAVEAGKRYCPHWLSGGIGLMASAHLLSAVGGQGLLEVDSNPNPLRASLAQPFPDLVEGAFVLTHAPGIGVEPDMRAASPFLVAEHEAA